MEWIEFKKKFTDILFGMFGISMLALIIEAMVLLWRAGSCLR